MRASMLTRLRLSALGARTSTRVLAGASAFTLLFTFLAVTLHTRPPVVAVVLGAALFVLTAASLARARLDRGVIVIILIGLAFYLAYLGYTSFGERNYDGGVQLEYIEYLVKNKARPPASKCLICHHPPLYYVSSAFVYAFFKATKLAEPTVGIQIFGLLLFLTFLGYGAATARLLLKDSRDQRLATALMVFWPYSYHNSVRLHNDSMVSTFLAMAIYHLVKWSQKSRPRDLYLTAIFTGLGLLTKSSAYALVPVIGALLVVRFFRSQDRLRLLLRGTFAVGLIAAALALNTLGKDTPQAKNAPLCHKILGNACDIHKGQFVENKVRNYLYLDLPTFAAYPYAMAERDYAGRKYFWNHLLKSSLFGTHNTVPDRETAYEVNRVVAYALNGLLLAMTAYLLLGAASGRLQALRRWWVTVALVGSSVAFMVGFRALIPAPHHTDFRHVFQDVILVSILYAATMAHFRRRAPLLEQAGALFSGPFIALTIFYFLPKHDVAVRLLARTVHKDLALYSKVVPEGTPWDKESNLLIEEGHTVEMDVPNQPTARSVDVTFDNNDRYQIEIIGDTTTRIIIGPAKKKVTGLARYQEKLEHPVANVQKLRVRALSGDMAYTMGHLVLR